MIKANNCEGWLQQGDIIMDFSTQSQRRYLSTVVTLIQASRIRTQSRDEFATDFGDSFLLDLVSALIVYIYL
jgi:hypothetical protein